MNRSRSGHAGAPRSARPGSRGFTYIGLLIVLIILGISLGAAGKYWSNIVLRDKEEELLFRGDQYRSAIERYYFAVPTRPQYPASIENLLKDERTPVGKRHLRKQYKDPITGGDFELIRDQLSKRIIGVQSTSDKTTLKHANFPEQYTDFEGKERYNEWLFMSTIKTAGTGTLGKPASQPTTTK